METEPESRNIRIFNLDHYGILSELLIKKVPKIYFQTTSSTTKTEKATSKKQMEKEMEKR